MERHSGPLKIVSHLVYKKDGYAPSYDLVTVAQVQVYMNTKRLQRPRLCQIVRNACLITIVLCGHHMERHSGPGPLIVS